MSSISTETIHATKELLSNLLRSAHSDAVIMHHRMLLGFTDNVNSFSVNKMAQTIFEPIGSIGGRADRSIIIYQTQHGKEVGFGLYDDEHETCYPLDIDGVIECMTPTDGEDRNEQTMLELMTTVIERIAPV